MTKVTENLVLLTGPMMKPHEIRGCPSRSYLGWSSIQFHPHKACLKILCRGKGQSLLELAFINCNVHCFGFWLFATTLHHQSLVWSHVLEFKVSEQDDIAVLKGTRMPSSFMRADAIGPGSTVYITGFASPTAISNSHAARKQQGTGLPGPGGYDRDRAR